MLTSSWPTAFSLPLIGYSWILVAVRLTSFRTTQIDRRVNLIFTVITTASTLREPTLQSWIVTLSGRQLSPAFLFQFAMVLVGAIVGVNLLTIGAAAGRAYRPVVVHGIALTSATVAFLFGTSARRQGIAIGDENGWAPLGFWLSMVPWTAWFDYLIIEVGVTELRKAPERKEFLVYGALALFPLVHLIGYSSAPIAAVFLIRGERNVFTALMLAADRDVLLYQSALFAVGMTMPIVLRLAGRLGLDRAARSRKRLLPLWSDLTAACPEIVYRDPALDLGSRYLLHRTVIEIRDCLRILSRYAQEPASLAGDAHAVRDYALQLAHACAAKSAGAPASAAVLALPSTAGDVGAETAELTALAAHWNHARTVVLLSPHPG